MMAGFATLTRPRCRVEEGRGCRTRSRLPSPLIERSMRISRTTLSDWFHRGHTAAGQHERPPCAHPALAPRHSLLGRFLVSSVLRRLAPIHQPSPSSTSTPEVRVLPSTGITRLHRCRVGGGALDCSRAGLRPPLSRVEDWRAGFGRDASRPIHVSSPRHIERNMRISRIALPHLLHVEVYGTYPAGATFGSA